jgi:hypothetical protein
MAKRKSGATEELLPLHTFLHRHIQSLPGLTNVEIARVLGYPKPNVVAMMLTGSMKVPINKVPALAQALELDPLALLRRVMTAYAPEMWDTFESVIGEDRLITTNEARLLQHVRDHLGAEDVALLDDPKFEPELTKLLLSALDRHARVVLASRRTDRPARESRAGKANAAMLDLLRRQAAERAALMRADLAADKRPDGTD